MQEVASGKLDLEAIASLSSQDLIARLMELDGVGIKIASCIALFGYNRYEIFPIDVWIARVVNKVYGGKNPAERLGKYAAVMQQCWYWYARQNPSEFIE